MTDKTRLFKEEINNIHVPTEKLDAIILNTFQGNVHKRKRSKRNKMLYSVSTAAVAFILLISSATVSPAMANIVSKIPIIGTVFSESRDPGLEQVHDQGLTNILGATKSVGQTSITLDEVFYDETRLTIGFSMTSENPIGEFYLSSGPQLTINGKAFSHAGTYSETEISPTKRTGIINIDSNSIDDLPEAFTLGVTFTGEDGKQWDFLNPVSKKSKVQSVAINHTQEIKGIELTVSDLKVSPAGMQFIFNAKSEKINYLSNGNIDFKVVDDKGNELMSHSGGSEIQIINGMENMTGARLIDPIRDNVKTLTVIPYIKFHNGGTSVEVDNEGNETKTELKPFEGTDFEFESFTVTLP
ncbi:DUF4179 domain-containing protein [Lysinibacillus sp. CNPSo 3705]|uniref:DUF4179 domain-containing protein n=1 Tax=Lysinibacillus sp. CNPSo 3705 TaxID=3028148 RepID=UPI002364A482|nr:DUF4179 domain-containing protein [Lysinibacillus sp. CNPSo 3705]MDD1505405.1 DUF4179 domain-containing protein [Lysinibacillus sp. CNPSo 3705]